MNPRNVAYSAAFATAVMLSSCSSSKSDASATSTTTKAEASTSTTERSLTSTTSALSTASTSANASGSPTSDRELEALLVTDVPAGFELEPDGVGDTGPSDLAKAARDDDTPGVAEVLRREGFVRGYQRVWVGPDGAEIIVFVYQFQSVTGAEADFERDKPEVADGAPPGASRFTVEGLPADRTVGLAAMSEDGAAAVVLFTTGVYNVQVVANGPGLPGLEERASAIAKDQNARL